MKAIVLEEFGGREGLRHIDTATHRGCRGEILVKVRSASANRTLDCTVRAGKPREAAKAQRIFE